jgi:hypothetical protein
VGYSDVVCGIRIRYVGYSNVAWDKNKICLLATSIKWWISSSLLYYK